MPHTTKIIPVILCGGAGSRLWPLSRESHPKPFIRLEDGKSLLQKAFVRAARLPGIEEIVTVSNRELLFKTTDDYAEVNEWGVRTRYILEPVGRNTAAAVAAAASDIQASHGPDAILLVLAADHLICDEAAFSLAVQEAVTQASDGLLVTFGIQPDRPETAYGYIEFNGKSVLRFVEKPPADEAKSFIESGRFLWNSGMFCFKAGTILKEMQRLCPEVLSAVQHCLASSSAIEGSHVKQLLLDSKRFAQVPEISLDVAVMERSDSVSVVPCDIGWSDVGSWSALAELTPADSAGNRVVGETALHNVSNCFIQSGKRLVGAAGVSDLIIIDTSDALLVVDRNCAQDVKHLYNQLKSRNHTAHKLHSTVHRPWGTYTVLEEDSGYKIKRIEVRPGASLSLQMHHHRNEHWIVVSGMARVSNGEKELFVRRNESTYIPAGEKHRLENPGLLTLVMIEVQSGEYLGEEDIVRFDDKYGRM